ncbi:hypothetical protein [Sphingobacterium sp. LRF_L2]|uniref:hypothetical protein n=1 Tax=Sphingobacterium sp. LRF_L2 TaxID=3369421 RepID=UPI003F63382B
MRKIERESLEKYLLGKSSKEESNRIEQWLKEDAVWDVHSEREIDTDRKAQLWRRLALQIDKKDKSQITARTIRSIARPFYTAVAAVALVFFIGKAYYYSDKDTFPKLEVVSTPQKIDTWLDHAKSLYLVGFPNVRKKVYYEVDPDSHIELFTKNGNIVFRNGQKKDARIKFATSDTDFTEFVARQGETYVIVYTGEDELLRRAKNLVVLPVDQLADFPPHEAIRWTKDRLEQSYKMEKG